MENETKFRILRREVLNDIYAKYENVFNDLKTEEGLNKWLQWENKKYKVNPKDKFIKYLKNKRQNELIKQIEYISEIENASDFSGDFIITIEWKKSAMWRSNPMAYTNYGFTSRSIGGCGYDKQSTATAEALNSHLPILKLLFSKKDSELLDYIKNHPESDIKNGYNRAVLGYGSGYNILPKFEGGVGVSAHMRILENVGLQMRHIANNRNSDVFLIAKKETF